jgi:hypothetical protein
MYQVLVYMLYFVNLHVGSCSEVGHQQRLLVSLTERKERSLKLENSSTQTRSRETTFQAFKRIPWVLGFQSWFRAWRVGLNNGTAGGCRETIRYRRKCDQKGEVRMEKTQKISNSAECVMAMKMKSGWCVCHMFYLCFKIVLRIGTISCWLCRWLLTL